MKKEVKFIATMEVNFKDGKKEVEMELKNPQELYDCEEGKAIVLILQNEEGYTGIFKGMEEEDIMLGSLSQEHTIGLNICHIVTYFEQITKSND
jgi:hypothetical protein